MGDLVVEVRLGVVDEPHDDVPEEPANKDSQHRAAEQQERSLGPPPRFPPKDRLIADPLPVDVHQYS